MPTFKVGDKVDKLVFSFFGEVWETGYIVAEPPSDTPKHLVYIHRWNSNGKVLVGVKPEHLRRMPKLTLKDIEFETPKDGWLCWNCIKLNRHADIRTQVEKDGRCVHVCRYCKADEHPF
jgi:hypothetical protein